MSYLLHVICRRRPKISGGYFLSSFTVISPLLCLQQQQIHPPCPLYPKFPKANTICYHSDGKSPPNPSHFFFYYKQKIPFRIVCGENPPYLRFSRIFSLSLSLRFSIFPDDDEIAQWNQRHVKNVNSIIRRAVVTP